MRSRFSTSGKRKGRQLRREASGGRWDHTYAALDLGTNNCRLLVARPARDGFRVIDSFSRIVRLGEGVNATGKLSETAMKRAIAALQICATKMKRRQVTVSRCVATAACRQADNGDAFLARVGDETGIDLETIDTAEEARLAMAGCAPLLDQKCENAMVFDIGGGSTEVMWLRRFGDSAPELLAWTSVPYGVVTLAEAYGGTDIPLETYQAMVERIRELLVPFEQNHGLAEQVGSGAAQMVGTSGTVTTLAALNLGLPRYERRLIDGTWLDANAIANVSARLSAMSYEDRSQHPCIGEGRADLVIAGCAIFDAIFQTWPAPGVRVADRGVRDGMLFHLMAAADSGTAAKPDLGPPSVATAQ
jgi:exopolyphosphatase/guanosine-5'-triphosphate,3'-diphosphate pyrophosphatase